MTTDRNKMKSKTEPSLSISSYKDYLDKYFPNLQKQEQHTEASPEILGTLLAAESLQHRKFNIA